MRRTELFQTEKRAYKVTQMGAIEGRGALLRAQKIAVKASGGIDAMIDAMTVADLDYFCGLFAKQTKANLEGDKWPVLASVFDEVFAGDYFEMVQWLSFCLGFEFGVFFQQIQTNGEKIKAAAMAGLGDTAQTPTSSDEP